MYDEMAYCVKPYDILLVKPNEREKEGPSVEYWHFLVSQPIGHAVVDAGCVKIYFLFCFVLFVL